MIPVRDENPTRRIPVFNTLFLILNVMVFFVQAFIPELGDEMVKALAFVPSAFADDPAHNWHRLLAYQFLHGGFLHLAGNMLFLYIFGDNIEDSFGHLRYLLFYLVSGVFAALLQGAFSIQSQIPLVGASGAISGVIAAYMIFFPMQRVLTIVFLGIIPIPVRIPALLYIAFWIVMQALMAVFGATSGDRGGVAYLAHVGGAAFGIIYALRIRSALRRKAARGWR